MLGYEIIVDMVYFPVCLLVEDTCPTWFSGHLICIIGRLFCYWSLRVINRYKMRRTDQP